LLASLAYAGFIILSKKTVAEYSSLAVVLYAYSATAVFGSLFLNQQQTIQTLIGGILILSAGYIGSLKINGKHTRKITKKQG